MARKARRRKRRAHGSDRTTERRTCHAWARRRISLRASRAGRWLANGIGADAAKLRTRFAALARARCGSRAHEASVRTLADLAVRHTGKRTDARDCSTGEQKALLISIVLANAWLRARGHNGVAPMLLLDEIAAHLDVKRRAALFEEILVLRCAGLDDGHRYELVRAVARARATLRGRGRPIRAG